MSSHYVYRLYDSADRLLYVGCSSNVEQRLGQHRIRMPWWSEYARCAIEGPFTMQAALDAEKRTILSESPRYNVAHNVANAPVRFTHPTILNTARAAEMFGVNPQTVITWANSGKLAHFRTPGGHRRFLLADVEALLASTRSGTQDAA